MVNKYLNEIGIVSTSDLDNPFEMDEIKSFEIELAKFLSKFGKENPFRR